MRHPISLTNHFLAEHRCSLVLEAELVGPQMRDLFVITVERFKDRFENIKWDTDFLLNPQNFYVASSEEKIQSQHSSDRLVHYRRDAVSKPHINLRYLTLARFIGSSRMNGMSDVSYFSPLFRADSDCSGQLLKRTCGHKKLWGFVSAWWMSY